MRNGRLSYQNEMNILTTKLYVPPLRPQLVLRHRLLQKLEANPQQTAQLGEQALAHLLPESHIWRGVVSISLGMAYCFLGNLPQATEAFANAAHLSHEEIIQKAEIIMAEQPRLPLARSDTARGRNGRCRHQTF